MNDKYLKIGDNAPDFQLENSKNEKKDLSSYKNNWTIVYFYPKDNTSGCTLEAIDFTKKLDEIKSLGANVVGISPDDIAKHNKFIGKHDLKIELLSDPDKKMLGDYGVWQMKKMFGKEYMGVVRTTYLLDGEGIVRYVWKRVRVKGHVEKVIEKLKELKG